MHIWSEGRLYNPAPDADPTAEFELLVPGLADLADDARGLYARFVGAGVWLDAKCFLASALRKKKRSRATNYALGFLEEVFGALSDYGVNHRATMTPEQEAQIARMLHERLSRLNEHCPQEIGS